MDILKFINLKYIREHLRNIGYIYKRRDATIEEKHKMRNECIEKMPDCPIAEQLNNVPQNSLHTVLKQDMHIKIWLDDLREAPEGYCHCHSVNETIRKIIECEKKYVVIDEIDCDHDLGDYASDGGDGIKLIDWLAERKTHYPVKLHTMNPVGRENMQREIDRYWNETK